MKQTPTFAFILGAARCGTATLFNSLAQHPDICSSSTKEPVFFQVEKTPTQQSYLNEVYPTYKNQEICLEAAHRNLYLPYVPRRISDCIPNAKVIIVVRNPVVRAISHYWYYFSRGIETLSFEDAIQDDLDRMKRGHLFSSQEIHDDYLATRGLPTGEPYFRTYVDSGFYAEQIERLVRFFPKENLKIIKSEDFYARRLNILAEVSEFLNIGNYPDYELPKTTNRSRSLWVQTTISWLTTLRVRRYVPDSIKMHAIPILERLEGIYNRKGQKPFTADESTIRRLHDIYRPHNKSLIQYVDFDITDWDRLN